MMNLMHCNDTWTNFEKHFTATLMIKRNAWQVFPKPLTTSTLELTQHEKNETSEQVLRFLVT
jgi:hypothetical protein